jgi:4-diphosphocytidyl-2C-methyl-D-erythritol kinase
MATGRGELLRALNLPAGAQARSLVIAVPDVAISTGMVYSNYEIPKSRLTAWKAVSTLVQLRALSYFRDRAKRKLVNDLEGVVRARVRAVPEALRDLRSAGAINVRMSGSGSAVFGIVPAGVSPRAVADRVRRTLHKVYVVRPVRAGSRPCR